LKNDKNSNLKYVPDSAKIAVDSENGYRRLALFGVADRVQLAEALQQLVNLILLGQQLLFLLSLNKNNCHFELLRNLTWLYSALSVVCMTCT
jgi:hypothetical protein